MKISLIYGGKSAEHDISILTAFSIIKEVYYKYYEVQPIYITKAGQWIKGPVLTEPVTNHDQLKFKINDETTNTQQLSGVEIQPTSLKEEDAVIFPVLHGPNGEDGTVQGLFEVINMPYVGTGVLASACGMDKIISKYLFQQAGIPQVPYVAVLKNEWLRDEEQVFMRCEGSLLYPMFVKPANMGSSVGITKAENRFELISAIKTALKYDRRIVVEQGIEAREIEVAVLGNSDVHTSVPGEIVKSVDFYDYDSKYLTNDVQLQIPALVPDSVSAQLREYAAAAFEVLDGSGLSRCDFFVTANDEIFINEVNTMPGFTQFSMYPLLWENTGLSYGDLVEELIQLALRRFEERQAYQMKSDE
ncbi:D-alanine--D-alanine ligase [Carnobacterium maltaromaticum]|uniref:D-alanine--D-alanine ligase n=1 Tax=Carnobacterium maltaromaticum TaxID=2751 RepID=UPI000C777C02|nr:D-alanine--D-alanine ligase [Carnobacterium maltaromaticum]PLS32651.1 D-alanine--D-alanine ligase [Carnobacterium maltaromaticum]PLS32831.1 D-alanine--D-alanine ligase [Carnobacterium maltaromaticum]PLS33416.1 D-alanine--D-alanine ligase [Carnobacterium maltaromaticum]PLS40818.1 D-alanine--D-alanine ligase [Carnobacterium maltaromaticum]PLS41215.1 D-alanine--D-alanine ligase [Carnobacterium maltaromaticum]